MWSSGCPIICLLDIWMSLKQVAKFNWTIAAKSKFKTVLECLALSKISARAIICAVPWKQHWLEQIPSRAICRYLSVYPSFPWSEGTLMVLRAIQRNNSFSTPLSLKTMTDDYMLEVYGHSTKDSVALATLAVHSTSGTHFRAPFAYLVYISKSPTFHCYSRKMLDS